MQACAQKMQHTHTHKAVTEHVEAKKLLSYRRQSNYSLESTSGLSAPQRTTLSNILLYVWQYMHSPFFFDGESLAGDREGFVIASGWFASLAMRNDRLRKIHNTFSTAW